MMQSKRKYFLLLLPLVLLIQAAIVAPSKVIRVGVYENEPKIYTNVSGEVVGFWPEILEYIAAEEKWQIEWVHGTWEQGLERLEKGEIDIMPDVAFSEERSKKYAFSNEIVLVSWSRVYVAKDSGIRSIFDLEGKKIAVLVDSINYVGPEGIRETFRNFDVNVTFLEMDSYIDVFNSLASGESDAGVTNKYFGNKNEVLFDIDRTPIILTPVHLLFALPKNARQTPYLIERIDSHLEALKSDKHSAYYLILETWLSGEKTRDVFPLWAEWAVGVLILVTIILFLGSVFLRSEVRKRKAELEESESKYRTLVDNSLVGIYITKNHIIRFANQGLADLFGYPSAGDMLGIRVKDLVTPQSWGTVQKEVQLREIGQKEFSRYQFQGLRGDGSVVDIEALGGIIQYQGQAALQGVLVDITERLQAEQRFKSLSESSFEAIFISEKGICLEQNLAAEKLFGYTFEEAVGKLGTDWIALEDRDMVIANMLSGYEDPYLATALCKDGRTFPAEIQAKMMGYKGRAVRVTGLRDISVRARAEDELRKSEKKFRDLFEKSEDALLIIENGEFVACNQATVKMLRYKDKSDFLNTHPSALSPEKQPDGQESFKKVDKMMKIAIENGSHRFVWDHKRADGEIFPVEVLLTAITIDDDRQMLHTTWRDITERVKAEEVLQESEAHYRLLAENITDIVWTMDLSFHFTYMSPAITRIGGYSVDEAMSLSLDEMFTSASFEIILKAFEEEISIEQTYPKDAFRSRAIELELQHKDGHIVWTEIFASFLRDADDEPVGILGITRDITEQMLAEKTLKESKALFTKAQEIAQLGSWELDIRNNTLFWSDEVYRIFDLEPQEFKATYEAFLDNIHPEDRELVNHAYAKSLEDKTPYDIVHRLLLSNGILKFVRERCETSYDDTDNPIRSIGTIQDITEQVKAEQILLDHTQRLEMMNTISLALSASLQLEALLEVILEEASLIISFDSASIFFVEDDGQLTIGKAMGDAAKFTGISVPHSDTLMQGFETEQKILILDDATQSPYYKAWDDAPLIRGWMGLRLIARDSLVGYLTFDSRHPESFSPQDAALAESFSPQIAQALYNARLHGRVIQDTNEMEKRVQERTEELQNFVELTAGREIRMMELKGVISKLRTQLVEAGQVPVTDDPLNPTE